jgi:hypothetical protein
MRAPRCVAGGAGKLRLSALLRSEGVQQGAFILLVAHGLRGMCDGFIAVLLPG